MKLFLFDCETTNLNFETGAIHQISGCVIIDNMVNNGKIYKDGKTPTCKACIKDAKKLYYLNNKKKIKETVSKYYDLNKNKIIEKSKNYYKENIDIIKLKFKRYREDNLEYFKEYAKQYQKDNSEKIKIKTKIWRKNCPNFNIIKQKYIKNRKSKDPVFRLECNIRSAINSSIREHNYAKANKTVNILGINFEEFKLYLELKFDTWMNWENYGLYNGELNYGWDIDHIIPLSSAKTEEDLIKLNHYTNLQPLCSKTNRDIKRDLIL